ncbi:hypothetical protein [Sphingomonas sp.]|uniref:hypothetical protein n=1 Tax=Sphingomonas sp. TaxID=28214 RepID=UPI0035B08112
MAPVARYGSPYTPVAFDSATLPALRWEVAARALELHLGLDGVCLGSRTKWPRFRAGRKELPDGVLALAPDGLALVTRFNRRCEWDLRWKPGMRSTPD